MHNNRLPWGVYIGVAITLALHGLFNLSAIHLLGAAAELLLGYFMLGKLDQ